MKNNLYDPANIRRCSILGIGLLLLIIVAEFFIKPHPHFPLAAFFAFHALYGFFSCVLMVIIAKLLGFFIKRKDDYYDL